ncbi:WXG100 family type VII secretion target [Streptomyces sp. XD-27]|uniref:WXG100 family type VII secretion target n=1 Tax=Streptomyces sp. XD-27 TaxID=3062779 RepID=UPI0026F40D5F|nr:WXG100 family type VII secretion target [Streptomyces sp. XD-27]WKX70977.1 WXG100 family type VII secretion target [Streptomyces sp. XD-27]
MGFKGADTELLRGLSGTFKTQHTNLSQLITAINNGTKNSDSFWKGGRANNFRDQWDQLKPQLDKFLVSLDGARKETDAAARDNDTAND